MRLLPLALAVALSACATSRGEVDASGAPSLAVSADAPAPARARFYADCLAQSAAEQTYFREERNDELLRFNCSGDVAKRFFDGLGAHSAAISSEIVVGIRTWRFTQRIRRDTVGLDYCWRDAPNANAEPLYECTVVLNVGAFLRD